MVRHDFEIDYSLHGDRHAVVADQHVADPQGTVAGPAFLQQPERVRFRRADDCVLHMQIHNRSDPLECLQHPPQQVAAEIEMSHVKIAVSYAKAVLAKAPIIQESSGPEGNQPI